MEAEHITLPIHTKDQMRNLVIFTKHDRHVSIDVARHLIAKIHEAGQRVNQVPQELLDSGLQ